ncbi:hypothetical protein HA466_0022990 [Hirschfeldia incana]|nr:hypothetical protein HA466_0022990 [Hirschfeldia incana]
MARQRPKQLEPNRIGSSKLGFDGEEDGWVFVKKQRVIIVLPSLPLPEPFTVEKPPPDTSHPQAAELRDSVVAADNQEAVRVVGPSLPLVLQKPETCQSLVELRDVIAADIHKSTPAYTTVSSSLPRPQDFIWQKRVTSQSQAELNTTLHSVVPSLPLPEPFVLQKPSSSQLQAELRDGIADVQKATPVHTVVPYVSVPEHHTLQKPETSQTRAEFRADKHGASLVHTTVVPSLPVTEHITLQKPATSKSQAEFRARKATHVQTVMPSLPGTEHITLQKNPATSHSQADLRARKATLVHSVVPSLPVTERITFQNSATLQSQADLRAAETRKTTLAHNVVPFGPVNERTITLQKPDTSQSKAEETRSATLASTVRPLLSVTEHRSSQKPVTSQSQAELRAKETLKATRVQAVAPSLPVLEHCTLQKPATSQSQASLRAKEMSKDTLVQAVMPSLPVLDYCTLQKPARDFAPDAQETADFQAVDKPERVMDRRKAPPPSGPRRSLLDPHRRRLATQRTRGAGHNKPVRFPRVMCSSVAMDNEKLRVVNLEKKVERAGGLNEWVGSIGLGREFERMLRGQRMSKFQMANLTMEKLKQMGALAVGPRRKLIHAIRCVYHPHCLRAPFH